MGDLGFACLEDVLSQKWKRITFLRHRKLPPPLPRAPDRRQVVGVDLREGVLAVGLRPKVDEPHRRRLERRTDAQIARLADRPGRQSRALRAPAACGEVSVPTLKAWARHDAAPQAQ